MKSRSKSAAEPRHLRLIAIVEAWSFARSFESFFEDMQQRVSTLPAERETPS